MRKWIYNDPGWRHYAVGGDEKKIAWTSCRRKKCGKYSVFLGTLKLKEIRTKG